VAGKGTRLLTLAVEYESSAGKVACSVVTKKKKVIISGGKRQFFSFLLLECCLLNWIRVNFTPQLKINK
jgi:hypothetical protein